MMIKNIKKNNSDSGLIIVYTGDGKGKTTAALGLALRSAGWEKPVAIVQFIKGYKATGEWNFIKNCRNIEIFQTFNTKVAAISTPNFTHKGPANKALKVFKKLTEKNLHQVIILDEILNAIFYDLVEAGEIIKILKEKPKEQTIVLTGRGATKEIIGIADIVTEMKKIKHAFDRGIQAKRGIDY